MQNYSFFPLHFHGFSRTTRLCYCLCCLFVYSLFFLFEGFFVFLCARCQPTIRYCSLLSSHNSLACSLFFFFSWKKSEVGIHFQECRLYWNSKLSLSLWLLLFLPLLSILLLLLFFSSSFTLVGEVEVEKVCTLFLFFFFLPWNLCFLCSVFFIYLFFLHHVLGGSLSFAVSKGAPLAAWFCEYRSTSTILDPSFASAFLCLGFPFFVDCT